MTGTKLAEGLRLLAANAHTVAVPPDLWRRGVRRRRRIAAMTAVVVLAVLAVPTALVVGAPDGYAPAASGPTVPRRVYAPRLFEPLAENDPPGPAVILVGGRGAFEGTALSVSESESRSLVVGANGTYRLARDESGWDMLLSPDGRYVAGGDVVDGVFDIRREMSVLDLESGKIRVFPDGQPLAWAPDGQQILIVNVDEKLLKLLDLRTGTTTQVSQADPGQLRSPWLASFAPDGRRVALQIGDTLYVVDLRTGTKRTLADFDSRRRLAGPGAWLPDGRTIAVLDIAGCMTDCDSRALDSRMWTVAYLDVESGRRTGGPRLDGVVAIGAALLGWQRDGAAVMTRHDANSFIHNGPLRYTWNDASSEATRNVELIRLTPGGGRQRLVELPPGALVVDLPRDVIESGGFGGPSKSPVEGWIRNAIGPVMPLVILFWPLLIPVGLVLLAVLIGVYRGLRSRFGRGEALPPIAVRYPTRDGLP